MPDLKAVLFLSGPAQLMGFVCDVSKTTVDIIDDWGIVRRYKLEPSKHLGPEGWVAVEDETLPLRHYRHSRSE